MTRRRLLYLGGSLPDNGPSSPIVLLRHFTRLTCDGWTIAIAHPEATPRPSSWPSEWVSIPLPMRRAWWPPVRETVPGSRRLRRWLLSREINRRFPLRRVDAIFTLLPDFPEEWQELAALLGRRYGVATSILVHDAAEAWTQSPVERARVHERTRRRLALANRVWFISRELAAYYALADAANIRVLRPIPAGASVERAVWREQHATAPVLAHAGKLFPEYLPTLSTLLQQAETAGATLQLVSDPDTAGLREWLRRHPRVVFQPFFETNEEGLNFLRAKASVLLVFYPEESAGCSWSMTSFPSKLVEYVQLGMPILIVADKQTALGRWAAEKGWPTWVEDAGTIATAELLRQLRQRERWEAAAVAALRVAHGEFSVETIHAQLCRELPRPKG